MHLVVVALGSAYIPRTTPYQKSVLENIFYLLSQKLSLLEPKEPKKPLLASVTYNNPDYE